MALRYYRNGPARALAAPLANATDTSITVDNASGFPTQFPYTLILDPNQATEEVVDVTGAVANVLAIVRGADSTTAVAHATGAVVWHGISARDLREANDHVNATSNVHGGTGGVVDTGSVQTITAAKTFTGGLNTAPGTPVVSTAGDQTINGVKTFASTPTTSTNGDVATLGGAQTFTGTKTFAAITTTGTQTHSGAESHSGTETHTGNETHSGTAQFSNSVHQWVAAVDSVNSESNSTTTYLPGTVPTGLTFTSPPSGRVMITISSYFGQTTNANEAVVSFSLRTGSTVGSGTVVLAASGNRALVCGMAVNSGAPARLQASRRVAVNGLTPGAAYNVRIEFATSPAGACAVFAREIIVEPCF